MRKLNIRPCNCLRRAMAAALAGVLAVSLSVNAFAAESSFSDVPASHAFHDAIIWCAGQSIVGGYTDGSFQPAKTVTRSNFTVMLSRAFYADKVARSQTEANLAYGTFYPNFKVMLMYGALNNTSFSTWDDIRSASVMNKGINRYDMAQLMTNIMNAKGFAASSSDKNDAISKIADYNKIPSQYKDAVSNVYALGIIGGYSDGTFGGEVTMNRGQAAIVIYRMMQFSGGSSTEAGTTTTETPSTPSVPAPAEPETPTTPATLTLRDGSAVTEANARKILETVMAAYPGKSWLAGYTRDSSMTFNGLTLGSPSSAVRTISGNRLSITAGCGGLASMASDAIFGGGGTGGENFPARKLASVTEARVGDIYCELRNGTMTHMGIITAVGEASPGPNGTTKRVINKYDGGGQGGTSDTQSYIIDGTLANGASCEVWTRYPTPVEPETPTMPATLTLRDGSAVTEANALKIIEQIKQVYPVGAIWDSNTSRNAYIEINGRKLGSNSNAITTIGNTYNVSMSRACGGFAGLVSDAIFGGSDNGGSNFPIRKLDSVSQVRPGDILIMLDANGKQQHVLTAASSVTSSKVAKGVTVYNISTYEGNMNGGCVSYSQNNYYVFDDLYNNYYYEVWTRYPA